MSNAIEQSDEDDFLEQEYEWLEKRLELHEILRDNRDSTTHPSNVGPARP